MRRSVSVILLCCLAQACFTVRTITIGTKTSLEKQLIGELEPLSEDELLVASVRTTSGGSIVPVDELQMRALSARRRQLFNRDDVDELKASGCLGEGNEALLVVRPCEATRDAEVAERLARVTAEENADRGVVLDWAIATDASLTERDRPEVMKVYRRLLLEHARPGTWVQSDNGTWAQR